MVRDESTGDGREGNRQVVKFLVATRTTASVFGYSRAISNTSIPNGMRDEPDTAETTGSVICPSREITLVAIQDLRTT